MTLPKWDDDAEMLEWTYAHVDALRSSEAMHQVEFDAAIGDWLDLRAPFAEQAAITAAEELKYKPLIERLRSGQASPGLLNWLADHIERGKFSARKSRKTRLESSSVWRAVADVPFIEQFLRTQFQQRGPRGKQFRDRAVELAALRWKVDIERIHTDLRRSRKDRHRP
jgi:hypothetical protein